MREPALGEIGGFIDAPRVPAQLNDVSVPALDGHDSAQLPPGPGLTRLLVEHDTVRCLGEPTGEPDGVARLGRRRPFNQQLVQPHRRKRYRRHFLRHILGLAGARAEARHAGLGR